MEEHQKQSLVTALFLVTITVAMGFIIGYSDVDITGAGVYAGGVACSSNADCSDGISCTSDSCLSAGKVGSFCAHAPITFCQDDDGCCARGCTTETDNDCS
jgi:hypothetical protein